MKFFKNKKILISTILIIAIFSSIYIIFIKSDEPDSDIKIEDFRLIYDGKKITKDTEILKTQKISFEVDIKNTSEVNINKLKKPISISIDGKIIENLDFDNYKKSIKPNETVTLKSDTTWKTTAGSHNFTAIFDNYNKLKEIDETNNKSSLSLDVKDLSLKIKQGNQLDIKINKSTVLEYEIDGYEPKEADIYWYKAEESENNYFSINEEGKIKANSKGKEKVYVKIKNTEISASITINVENRKAIIVVPGYLGSSLYYNNRQVWPPKALDEFMNDKSISNLLKINSDLESIRCDKNGKSVNNIKINTDEKYGVYSKYGKLIKSIKNSTYYEEEFENIYFCSWDWRDIDIGVNNLNNLIKDIEEEDLYVITHSTGGLLTSKYMSKYKNNRIYSLITVASPFFGTPNMFEVMETGEIPYIANSLNLIESWAYSLTIKDTLIDLLHNFKSSYQLLPSQRYFENGNYFLYGNSFDKYLNYSSTSKYIKNEYNSTLFENNKTFQISINLSIYDNENFYNLIGCSKKTVGIFSDIDNIYNSMELKGFVDGDGVVPVVSANINGKTPSNSTFYIYNDENTDDLHGDLVSKKDVLNLIIYLLVGKTDKYNESLIKKTYKIKTYE
jgi:pimeloyl-ACP methyl ester carboxylesterase